MRQGSVTTPLLAFALVTTPGVLACLTIGPGTLSTAPAPHNQGAAQGDRTVWDGAGDGATISPDGRLIAFIDWNTSQVAVRDVSTGRERTLTDKGVFAGSVGFPEPYFVFSPGSDRVVFPFGNSRDAEPFRYELRMASVSDTVQRVLATYAPDVAFVAPLDWHETTGLLFTTVAADASSELLILRPDEGTARTLERRDEGAGLIQQGLYTPDGLAVVYLAKGMLHYLTLAGGDARMLGLGAEVLLGWTAGGATLLFHATRGEVTGNWSIGWKDGVPSGEPVLVQRTAAGVLPSGRSVAGVHYREPAVATALLAAELDLPSRTISRPQPLALHPGLVAGNPAWSRDGRRLAFTLHVPNRMTHRIMISEGGRASPREIARVDLRVMGLDWSTDGRFLFVGGRAETRARAWIGRIDVLTGTVERIVSNVPISALAAAGNQQVAFMIAAPAGERTVRLAILPADGGEPRVLTTYLSTELPRSMSVSPDGRWVALVKTLERTSSALLLVPTDGGDPRTLLRLERPDRLELNLGSLPWTADGRRVMVLLRQGGERYLGAVDAVSGELTLVPFAPQEAGRRQPALHPDGRFLVYVDGGVRDALRMIGSAR
ncbi:MAG TPA: hypothetical protein VLE53_00765 [Gemmatimonadaceae bacterium]|nr:hypothetical protein [Gemmatimonadaceae bacterium]